MSLRSKNFFFDVSLIQKHLTTTHHISGYEMLNLWAFGVDCFSKFEVIIALKIKRKCPPFLQGPWRVLVWVRPSPPPLPPCLLSSHSLCCYVMLLPIRRKKHCMMIQNGCVGDYPHYLEIPGFLLHHDPLSIGISSSMGWIWISFVTTHGQHEFKTPSP